jgi:hypothetical protein
MPDAVTNDHRTRAIFFLFLYFFVCFLAAALLLPPLPEF